MDGPNVQRFYFPQEIFTSYGDKTKGNKYRA
jgi:hypothetical protein